MDKRQTNFVVVGKVESRTAFNEALEVLRSLPGVEPRFSQVSDNWFYVTQDHRAAERAGMLRKRRSEP